MQLRRFFRCLLPIMGLAAAGLAFGTMPTQAQATFLITLNTSSLNTAAYTGPFVLDFQFIDGDSLVTGTPNPDNTATIYDFGGGTGFSAPAVMLVDGDPGASTPTGDAQVSFTPGSTLSFLTSLTTNEETYIPDAFSVGILNNGTEIPTQDAFGASNGSFVTISESSDPANPTTMDIETFDTSPAAFTPVVSDLTAPEPSSILPLTLGLAAVAAFARRRAALSK